MAYIVENLPPQGTMMLYRKDRAKVFHRSIIDSGIIMTVCGQRIQLAIRKPQFPGMPVSNANADELIKSPGLSKILLDNYPICKRCW